MLRLFIITRKALIKKGITEKLEKSKVKQMHQVTKKHDITSNTAETKNINKYISIHKKPIQHFCKIYGIRSSRSIYFKVLVIVNKIKLQTLVFFCVYVRYVSSFSHIHEKPSCAKTYTCVNVCV